MTDLSHLSKGVRNIIIAVRGGQRFCKSFRFKKTEKRRSCTYSSQVGNMQDQYPLNQQSKADICGPSVTVYWARKHLNHGQQNYDPQQLHRRSHPSAAPDRRGWHIVRPVHGNRVLFLDAAHVWADVDVGGIVTDIITAADKLACAEREVKMRERAYPRWIEDGRISAGKAAHEIATMKAIADDYRVSAEKERLL